MYRYINRNDIKNYIIKGRHGFYIRPVGGDVEEVINSTFIIMGQHGINRDWFLVPRVCNADNTLLFITRDHLTDSQLGIINNFIVSFNNMFLHTYFRWLTVNNTLRYF